MYFNVHIHNVIFTVFTFPRTLFTASIAVTSSFRAQFCRNHKKYEIYAMFSKWILSISININRRIMFQNVNSR